MERDEGSQRTELQTKFMAKSRQNDSDGKATASGEREWKIWRKVFATLTYIQGLFTPPVGTVGRRCYVKQHRWSHRGLRTNKWKRMLSQTLAAVMFSTQPD
jgi:hypothetical protein